ncbi:type II secretion system secretin GspD [Amphibiibacter pelophylacis]|uniref:Type II secretion system secretin GspD n=1 Tax=Amphibiibacter pelophylacis TaxID=1799477 RepID=A0ACC6P3S2_9BURK
MSHDTDRPDSRPQPQKAAALQRAALRPRLRPVVCALLVAAQLAPLAALPAQAQSRKESRKAAREEGLTLNFVNAEIDAVTRAMGAILNKPFVVDPRVRGTITLYSQEPLTPARAYSSFLAALRGLGYTVVDSGDLLKVVPEADAKLLASPVVTTPAARARGEQIVTQIFQLQYENPNSLLPVLRPLISPNNTINANPGNGTLVITDYADNLRRLATIISAMDRPASSQFDVVVLRYAIATDLAPLVQRLTGGGGGAAPVNVPTRRSGMAMPGAVQTGGDSDGSVTVLADPRNNSLILQAATRAQLAEARQLIARLDQPTQGPPGSVWVVPLKNADAVRLATVLRAAFPDAGSGAGGSGSAAAPVQAAPVVASGGSGAGASSAAATTPVTPVAPPSTGGFIQADPASNSLIITAPEPLYRQIRSAIDQLDMRRAQVYVESMIVKVDAEKLAAVGVQWQNLFGNKGDGTLLGLGTNFGSDGTNIIGLSAAAAQGLSGAASVAATAATGALGGLNVGILRSFGGIYTLGALARFLQQNTGANVLSTPNLVALDNEEAKIVIGQNVPFVTGSFTNTGSSGSSANPFQTIERQDVGLTLRVKSQIGEDGTIRMRIFQENSAVRSQSALGPTTDKSAIETTVVVNDGQTLVLGGLLKDEYTDEDNRVPGLGDLPLVGGLFRSRNRQRIKTDLMVFLRPVILPTSASADRLTLDRYDMIRARQAEAQPEPSSVMSNVNAGPQLPALIPPQPAAVIPVPLPVPATVVQPAPVPAPAPRPVPVPAAPLPAAPAPAAVTAPPAAPVQPDPVYPFANR